VRRVADRIRVRVGLEGDREQRAAAGGDDVDCAAAVGHDRWPDHDSRIVALVGVSLPAFWLAILLQWTVGLNIGAIPIGGRIAGSLGSPEAITRLYLLDSLITLDFDRFRSALAHLILPAFTLSMAPLAKKASPNSRCIRSPSGPKKLIACSASTLASARKIASPRHHDSARGREADRASTRRAHSGRRDAPHGHF
jgi:hypothetical protein